MRPSTTCWEIHRNAGATASPAPRESAGRFTPILRKWERLRKRGGSAAGLPGGFTAKTQREARLNPSETDLPRLLQSVCTASVFSASSANLAKIAHRGRYGTACPAMTTLRLWGSHRPHTPMKVRRSYVNNVVRFTPIVFEKRCFAEARSICLGRSEPRFLLRLRGNHTGSVKASWRPLRRA